MNRLYASPIPLSIFAIMICMLTSCCAPGLICFPPPSGTSIIKSERRGTPIVNNPGDTSSNQSTSTKTNPMYSDEPNIHSTIIAGPNISFKSSENESTYGGKHSPGIGFQAGLGTTWKPSNKFTLQSAILFKQQNASEKFQGYQYEPGGYGGNKEEKDKYSFNYISVPVLGMYNITKDLSAGAGPELNYLLGGSVKPAEGEKEKITKQLIRVGVAAQAVVKYKLPSKTTKSGLALQVVYDHRISRLNKKMMDGYEAPAWRMKGVQVSLLYNFCNCK